MSASNIKNGSILVADGGFDCILAGERTTVRRDEKGELFVPCSHGRHYLDGQLGADGETLVGFTLEANHP